MYIIIMCINVHEHKKLVTVILQSLYPNNTISIIVVTMSQKVVSGNVINSCSVKL